MEEDASETMWLKAAEAFREAKGKLGRGGEETLRQAQGKLEMTEAEWRRMKDVIKDALKEALREVLGEYLEKKNKP